MTGSLILVILICAATLIGDFCIKIASDRPEGLMSVWFVAGIALYGLPAVGWFFLMRSHSLATIGVLYSAVTVVLLAALGYFVFAETINGRHVAGIGCAIAAFVLMCEA